MKIIFILIILFSYALNNEKADFDFVNGVSKKFSTPLQLNGIYKFYIKAKKFQNVTICFHIDYIRDPPIKYLNVYEYSSRNNDKADIQKNLSVSTFAYGGEPVTFSPYNVSLSSTNYIAFELVPTRNISYMDVKIDITDGIYDISNQELKSINNIISEGTYIFYLQVKEEEKIDINITTNYINSKPFNSVYIYEYQERYDSFNYKKVSSLPISTTRINNELISSFHYTISTDQIYYYYRTNYLALRLVPSFNIDYMNVKMIILSENFDLNNGVSQTFTNLEPLTSYYFYTNANQNQNIKISLNMNNITQNPFSFVNLYEYQSKTSRYDKKSKELISFTTKNNKSESSISYSIEKYSTNYIVLKIKPLYYINYISIKIDVRGSSYNLTEGVQKNITNLFSESPYFFFIKAERFENVTINLNMNNMNNNPFTLIDIYEYENIAKNPVKSTSQSIIISKKDNELVSTFSYSVFDYTTRLIAFKITPIYDINYFVPNFEKEKCLYHIYRSELNPTIYILKVEINII